LVKPITEIKADGKHAVVITLDSGNVFFPYVLGSARAQIVPKGSTVEDFEKGIGTGPYILEHLGAGCVGACQTQSQFLEARRRQFR
jgi:MarR-like DNA-binding transcriptional regulator SgrR of sgrS sRNA